MKYSFSSRTKCIVQYIYIVISLRLGFRRNFLSVSPSYRQKIPTEKTISSHMGSLISTRFNEIKYYVKLPTCSTGTRIPDPLFPHLVPPAIMVWILVWKHIFEPFIHILFLGPAAVLLKIWINGSKIYFQTKIHTIIAGGTK